MDSTGQSKVDDKEEISVRPLPNDRASLQELQEQVQEFLEPREEIHHRQILVAEEWRQLSEDPSLFASRREYLTTQHDEISRSTASLDTRMPRILQYVPSIESEFMAVRQLAEQPMPELGKDVGDFLRAKLQFHWQLNSAFSDLLKPLQQLSARIESILDWYSQARHFEKFRQVHWFGMEFVFNDTQACCVQALWEAWEAGFQAMDRQTVISRAGVEQSRVDDIFRSTRAGQTHHDAWQVMILHEDARYSLKPLTPRPT